jgi:hypothetical protein
MRPVARFRQRSLPARVSVATTIALSPAVVPSGSGFTRGLPSIRFVLDLTPFALFTALVLLGVSLLWPETWWMPDVKPRSKTGS